MYTNDRIICFPATRKGIRIRQDMDEQTEQAPTDGRLRRGDVTRRAVLERAVDVASVDGLDGLSIGRLATELGISKSGLFAHFGSKEELQLATIRAARAIFSKTVILPAMETPPGLARVSALMEAWLGYSGGRQFPGGCFFARATHEYAARSGSVRAALVAVAGEWIELITHTIEEAQELGEVRSDTSPAQLAFDLDAYLESANLRSLLGGGAQDVYKLARESIHARLEAVSAGVPLP
jgi:AcrR family transcriptional regulator